MKRTPMKSYLYVRPPRPPLVPAPPGTLPAAAMWQNAGEVVAVPKAKPMRSEAYRRLIAKLPCWFCGIHGFSQAAHADQGKGMSIKSSDLTCYPLCGPHGIETGCHNRIGTAGMYDKMSRRALEEKAASDARAELVRRGIYDPKVRAVLVAVGLLA